MANEKHLLLTAVGDYTTAPMNAEAWAVTLRLALVFGPIDPVGTLPSNWDPVAVNINRTETDWTITGNWHVSSPDVFEPDDFLNDQAAPAFTSWIAGGPMSNYARLRALKLFPIGAPSGRAVPAPPYAQGTPCLLTWTSNYPTGATGSGVSPLQIAMVASHRTAQIGRKGRGRMFIPAVNPNQLEPTTTHFSAPRVTAAVTAQQALLQALTWSSPSPLAAHTHTIVTGAPFVSYAKINTVRIGDVPDTQRRRRRSMVETYSDLPIAP